MATSGFAFEAVPLPVLEQDLGCAEGWGEGGEIDLEAKVLPCVSGAAVGS